MKIIILFVSLYVVLNNILTVSGAVCCNGGKGKVACLTNYCNCPSGCGRFIYFL